MKVILRYFVLVFVMLSACATHKTANIKTAPASQETKAQPSLSNIQHIIVIYAENRSFDHLYGMFPNADGVANASKESRTQLDLDGSVMSTLPPVWASKPANKGGLVKIGVDGSFPTQLANGPFQIDALGSGHQLSDKTRDLVHKFYQNQAQINHGKNNMFAAYSDAGGLSMGYYDGQKMAMWKWAQEYTLADHFFMGAFGGSFLNHMYLICACAPKFDNAPTSLKAKLGDDGLLLKRADSPVSAKLGAPQYVADGALTPDGYAVNTMQPSYQPSAIKPVSAEKLSYANPKANPLPPQTMPTIGDALDEKSVDWAWYAEGWTLAQLDGMQAADKPRKVIYATQDGAINFQAHHQPFNYFEKYAPGTQARKLRLRDGNAFMQQIEDGSLPAVAFYKPAGVNNEHPGYADILSGDKHIADIVAKIQSSPIWKSSIVIVTYDENGGFWDHVAPPQGDRWGPGTRIPAMVISPFAKRHFVDHTVYDTGSIAKLIIKRFNLSPLAGLRSNTGDLTNALDFSAQFSSQ